VAAQLVQAAAAGRPDAADGDAQPGADLGVGHGRVLDQQADQLPARWRQIAERCAQRRVALSRQQLLLRRPGSLIGDGFGVRAMPGGQRPGHRTQDPQAFSLGHGGQPAGERGRIADRAQLVDRLQPDALADVLSVSVAQSVPAAD
jgi:hypothetical protein